MILVVNTVVKLLHGNPHKTRSALLASFLFFGLVLAGCTRGSGEPETLRLEGQTMGTSYHITIVAEPGKPLGEDSVALQADIDAQLVLINQHMSTYIADSELMLLNTAANDEWHYVSEPLREVLAISEKISRKSGGAFDITVGPLVNLWGFGPQKRDSLPSPEEIAAVKSRVGYQQLELVGHQVRKKADIWLDLSAVAKGYGVDWIASYLQERGFRHFMIEIGGELRLLGESPRGGPWRIAIEQPEILQASVRRVVSLTDAGMATSGDYRNYIEQDGKRYSHTLDPATGYPISHRLASVTVIAPTSAEADAWATALSVLGPEAGMALAEQEGLAAYMIIKVDDGFVDAYSTAFESYKHE